MEKSIKVITFGGHLGSGLSLARTGEDPDGGSERRTENSDFGPCKVVQLSRRGDPSALWLSSLSAVGSVLSTSTSIAIVTSYPCPLRAHPAAHLYREVNRALDPFVSGSPSRSTMPMPIPALSVSSRQVSFFSHPHLTRIHVVKTPTREGRHEIVP